MSVLADLHMESIEDGTEADFLEVVQMAVRPSLKEITSTQTTLVGLASEAGMISKMLLECGGELTPELEAKLEVNAKLLCEKADGYNYIIEELEAQEAIWKRRKDACAAIEKRFKTQTERLWERIRIAMREMGKNVIAGNLHKFCLEKGVDSLVIDDEKAIPNEFKIVVQTTAVDKEKLKASLKEGFEIPGAHLENKGRLIVRENSEE